MFLKSVVVAASLLLLSGIPAAGAEEPCFCQYEVEDEEDCKQASRASSGELVKWSTASDECLQVLNVSHRLLPSQTFWVVCPNANRTGTDYAELVSLMKNDPSNPVSQNLMDEFSDRGLFEPSDDGMWTLSSVIVTPMSVTLDCTVSPGLCWSEVNQELVAREVKMNRFCQNLNQQQIQAYMEEQAEARMMLCKESEMECEPLSSEVAAASTSDCSALGTTVPQYELPNCTAPADTSTTGGGGSGGASSVGSTFVSVGLIIVSLFM